MAPKPPSPRQLSYLKALADRTGQTFSWPHTSGQASSEIQRLENSRSTTELERAIERFGGPEAIEVSQNAVEIHGFEVVGYGSNCAWSQRA